MSSTSKDNLVKPGECRDGKPSLSRPASGSCLPLYTSKGASSKSRPYCKVIGTVKKSRLPLKCELKKDENIDSSNQNPRFSKEIGFRNSKCLFYELDEKPVDLGGLTRPEIDKARKSGTLKLTKRLLVEVPDLVWSIELPTEEDRKVIDVNFDKKDSQQWWTFKPLEYLDVSHNDLKKLSPKGSALYTLKELHANNNSINNISNEIGQCKELKMLTLHDNNLSQLPKSICSLTNITELLLQKNNLQELPENFGDLICLKKLDISSNKFVKIPYDIGYLTGLVELNMSHNQVEVLPEEVQGLRALKLLDVSNNNLNLIPSLNDMSNLTVFTASNNNVSVFPNFCGCRRLTEIRLENNHLKELIIDNLHGVPLNKLMVRSNMIIQLPEHISRLSTLVLLDVSENQITKLPYQLARLRNLSQLLVDGNPIEDIRQDILKNGTTRILAHLKRLSVGSTSNQTFDHSQPEPEVLSVYEKRLDEIHGPIRTDMRTTRCLILTSLELSALSPEILREAKDEHIFRIDLSRNKFLSIPDGLLTLNTCLTEIIIKQNNLRTVPDFIGQMKHLLHLDISNNRIEFLPSCMEACNLKGLIAECNCFTEIPEVVFSIKPLEHLNFRSNRIWEINVDGLKKLKYLFSLDLSNNNIDKVPAELGYLTQIKELHLYGNPFKLPRYSLLTKGTDAVMAYLRDKTAKHES